MDSDSVCDPETAAKAAQECISQVPFLMLI